MVECKHEWRLQTLGGDYEDKEYYFCIHCLACAIVSFKERTYEIEKLKEIK